MEDYYKKMKDKYGNAYITPDELSKGITRRRITKEERAMVEAFYESIMKCPECKTTFKESIKIC